MFNQNLNDKEIFPGEEFSGQFACTNLQAFIQSQSYADGEVEINIEGVSLALKDWIMDPDQPVPPSLVYQTNEAIQSTSLENKGAQGDWSFAPPTWVVGMKMANLPQSF